MSRPARFLFLADSGAEIGGGHVMRCLTLAEALASRGSACAFVAPAAVQRILGHYASPVIEALVAQAASVAGTAALAADWEADWIFVDHYRLSLAQEMALRGTGRRVGVLDDLAERRRDCDLVLDPSYGRRPEVYAPLTPEGCVILAGPQFALVRPAFAAARSAALDRRQGPDVRRVLVSLGLTDVGGITERVVQALLPHLGDVMLDVVLGAGAPSLAPLRELADPRIRLHVDTLAMAELMTSADLAVGAGGSSTWERCCLGLPSVTLVLADNQRPLAQTLQRDGVTIAVEAEDLESALPHAWASLASDAAARMAMVEASAALCDGLGAQRAAEALLRL